MITLVQTKSDTIYERPIFNFKQKNNTKNKLQINRQEGSNIMRWAKEAGLTGKSYVWIATQSVIGESKEALPDFPAGMLGKIVLLILFNSSPYVWDVLFNKIADFPWLEIN